MRLLREVVGELFGMFVADAHLTLALLIVVAISAAVLNYFSGPPLLGGTILTFGTLLVLLFSVRRAAQRVK